MAERGIEQDFPIGHPARADYDPTSPQAIEWARRNVAPLGERDFPVDHPAAADTPGNLAYVQIRAGVDPLNPQREAFTGRTPEQAAGIRALTEAASKAAKESPVLQPIDMLILNPMLEEKRAELGRDVLMSHEYAEVLKAYHEKHGAEVIAKRQAATPDEHTQAVRFVMDKGYSQEVAEEIVTKEGAIDILRAAGLAR